jgi:hypothetical protein
MVFYGFEYQEVMLNASATYALTDAMSVGSGVNLFKGDGEGMFGSYGENSGGYLECTFSF